MRTLLFCVALGAGGYVVWELSRPSPAPPPRPAAKSAREVDECRDQCEQRQIVAGTGGDEQLRAGGDSQLRAGADEELRACRVRCGDPASAAATRPHEVPSRITVAPVVTRPHVYSPPSQLPLQPAAPRR